MSGISFVIDSMNFLSAYIKPECKELPFTRLCKDNFIPEKIKEFSEAYKRRIDMSTRNASIQVTNENFKKWGGLQYAVSKLKPEARKRFEKDVSQRVESTYQCRMEAFNQGMPCYKVHLLLPKTSPVESFIADLFEDFDIPFELKNIPLFETQDDLQKLQKVAHLQRKRIRNSVINVCDKIRDFFGRVGFSKFCRSPISSIKMVCKDF